MFNKDKILEILLDWNFWEKDLETGIERTDYLKKMNQYLRTGMIISLVGLRRSGKSTLMLQFADRLIKKNKISKNDILYINFEDSRFLGEYSLELLNSIYSVYLENLRPKGPPFIFLDEVQNIEGWERFANSLHERKAANIFVSGSNAHLLSSELSTVLTGRQLVLNVYPLTFREFLSFHGSKVVTRLDLINQKIRIKGLFSEYLKFGGMPKAALIREKGEKEILLRNYFEDILNRDLISRFKIRQTEKLKILAKFYFSNITSSISYNKIKNFLKIPLTTIERFSDYLTQPFLLHFINKFSFSLKEQTVNPRKVYAGDLGLRNAISFNFSEDKGKLLENMVFLHLRKTEEEVYYYKTKNNLEVDFLIKEKQRVKSLIQVSVTIKNFDTREREIKSLLTAMKELKLSQGLILTEDEEDELVLDGAVISVIPLWKWLLQ